MEPMHCGSLVSQMSSRKNMLRSLATSLCASGTILMLILWRCTVNLFEISVSITYCLPYSPSLSVELPLLPFEKSERTGGCFTLFLSIPAPVMQPILSYTVIIAVWVEYCGAVAKAESWPLSWEFLVPRCMVRFLNPKWGSRSSSAVCVKWQMHSVILHTSFPLHKTVSFEPYKQFPGEDKYCRINKPSDWHCTKKSLLISCVDFRSCFQWSCVKQPIKIYPLFNQIWCGG